MSRLDELTRRELISDVETKVKLRSKYLKLPKYLGITKDYVVQFSIESSAGSASYVVKIKLVEYPSISYLRDLSTQDKVRLSLAGDLAMSCSCPAYRYWGYEYIMTQLSSNVGPDQDVYPQIRNPKLEGILCKHCYRTITSFGSYWSRIAKDIDNKHFSEEVS